MNQLEEALRTTLRSAAQDIAELPAHLTSTASAEAADRIARSRSADQRRRMLLTLAAAAAVVAVVTGVTVGVRVLNSAPPAHPQQTTTPHPTPSQLRASRCMTSLPAAWKHAITDSTVTAPSGWDLPPLLLAADGAGGALAVEFTDSFPRTYKLVSIAAHEPIQTLYQAPFVPATAEAEATASPIGGIAAEGHWVAFTAATASGDRTQVRLLDLDTHALHTVRTLPAGYSVLGARRELAMIGGAVYWTELPAGQGYGRMYRYDIATGRRSAVDEHATSGPLAVAGGAVYWNRGGVWNAQHATIDIASSPANAFQPTDVDWAQALTKVFPVLITDADGTYLWRNRHGAIMAGRPGAGAPLRLVPARRDSQPDGVTGHLLWGPGILDMRTGADAATQHLAYYQYYAGAGSVAVLTTLYPNRVVVLNTSKLPPLHC